MPGGAAGRAAGRLARRLPAGPGARPRDSGQPAGWTPENRRFPGYAAALAAELATSRSTRSWRLLLTTSGSTGSPKLVRLTAPEPGIQRPRHRDYLGLGPGERAVQSLPMHYSYGLSVLNSHLVAGATVVLTPHSFMRPEFWRDADEAGATSFAGVPYMYETLHRLRFDPARHPTLRTFTQAGGALRAGPDSPVPRAGYRGRVPG